MAHPGRLSRSKPLVPNLAQQLGGGTPQPRHGRPKSSQVTQRQRLPGADSGGQMRHGLATAGDDHLLARFDLVQKLAEVCFSSHAIYPTHRRAFANSRSHGPCSPHCGGCQECCTVRMVRSGCGNMIVTRPSGVVTPATPASEPLGLAG